MGKGHKIPESIRLRVLEAVNAGIGYSDIARSFKIGQTSVRRIAYAAQKISPETVSTPIEPASEEIIDSGASADNESITENPEDVKRDDYDDYSPYDDVIDEAVIEYSEKIQNRIAEMELHISNYKVVLARLEEYHQKYLEAVKSG